MSILLDEQAFKHSIELFVVTDSDEKIYKTHLIYTQDCWSFFKSDFSTKYFWLIGGQSFELI